MEFPTTDSIAAPISPTAGSLERSFLGSTRRRGIKCSSGCERKGTRLKFFKSFIRQLGFLRTDSTEKADPESAGLAFELFSSDLGSKTRLSL